jgi:hypothetical protein
MRQFIPRIRGSDPQLGGSGAVEDIAALFNDVQYANIATIDNLIAKWHIVLPKPHNKPTIAVRNCRNWLLSCETSLPVSNTKHQNRRRIDTAAF